MNDRPTLIAPSILASDFGNLSQEISSVADAGADWIHIDVMDGQFVPPITFGANAVEVANTSCNLFLDAHLMIETPDKRIEDFAKAGTSLLTVHQEVSPHLHRTLSSIRSHGMKSGVAINPSTPAEMVFDVLDLCDLVLVMTVNPGWGGQSFIQSCVSKIETLRNRASKNGLDLHIQVDGGVNAETGKICRQAGADVLVAGSYIFNHANRAEAINSLRN